MLKHVGRHGDRKVVVVFRKVPNEDHMALVTYSENLPSMVHDEVMKVVESVVGQQAGELADALHRHIMADGVNCLTALHKGGYMKKVQTKQVILTPNAKTSVRLDEVNNILDKMALGEEARQKLAEIDSQRGFRDPAKAVREVGEPLKTTSASMTGAVDTLSDSDLAQQRLAQATRMEAEAKGLLAEAKRLKEEAKSLQPAKSTNVKKPATKKTVKN